MGRTPESYALGAQKTWKTRHALLDKRDAVIPRQELATDYLSGAGGLALAERYGTTRNTVNRILRAHGVTPRGRSDAMRCRHRRLGADGRRALAASANKAARGRVVSFEEKCKRAKIVERRSLHTSKNDLALWKELGGTLVKAIGPYNVDIAVPPVAVEVFGGSWRGGSRGPHSSERFDYIVNSGWTFAFVWVTDDTDWVRCSKKLLTFIDETSRAPSVRRKHGVIRSSAKGSITNTQLNQLPAVLAREAFLHL